MVYLKPTVSTYHLVDKEGGSGLGGDFYRAGVTLCKEASGDTVSDECGLFKGPQGLTLSLIPQPPVGLLSVIPAD